MVPRPAPDVGAQPDAGTTPDAGAGPDAGTDPEDPRDDNGSAPVGSLAWAALTALALMRRRRRQD
ncbi:hypothetical protein LXT21_07760 [Myxococcus sp. K38C18041901]|uniref:hypothetical protein n=1 Tax=Myxococcus guangdongensis TaxID=2906760 RepID=UPI0020A83479|nr:hypothetical protein [Myxococcus guangdongensis]MCP3058663.1 hypothetical protein [Myxococcus guangdongensis]